MGKQIVRETMRLSYPKIPPHKNTSDYFKSRATLSRVQVRTYQWDKPRNDPELQLTGARRTFNRTEKALTDKRQYLKKARTLMEKQWEDLRSKETELKHTFEKMNNFIMTNEGKRVRAKQRFLEDSELCRKRSEEIEQLRERLAFMEKLKKDLDSQTLKHNLYTNYLDSVVSKSPDFKNSDNLIDRYESLVRTKKELGERQRGNLEQLEMAKSAMTKMTDKYMFCILGLNNVVADLNSRYRKAANDAMQWESLVWSIKSKAFRQFQEITEVKQACWNMYTMMCKRKGEATKIPQTDLENQMNYIKKTLRELRLVKEEAFHLSKKTVSSIKGQTSKVS